MATANNLKMLNIEKAKQHLKTGKPFTNISLSKASGLSVATCGNIIREMIATGEVKEVKKPIQQAADHQDRLYLTRIFLLSYLYMHAKKRIL